MTVYNICLGFVVSVVGCISFWLFGYAIAWSDGNCFVGWQHFAFYQLPADKLSMAFYQLIFSNTASTIVSGAVAERLNFPCYFIYAILLTGGTSALGRIFGDNQDERLCVIGR
jgi:ammonia channel protein AmtB